MNFIDFIILAVVVCLLALIIYFSFIKKKDGCRNCPQSKSCKDKKQKEDKKECDGDCSCCDRHKKDPPPRQSDR